MLIQNDPISIDDRVVRILETRHRKPLDPSYLAYLRSFRDHDHNAATPWYIDDITGATRQIGRFLSLADNHSEFEPPFRPSREFPSRDARIERSVLTLIEEDSPTAHALLGGEKLLPFAALYRGSCHPDDLLLGDCEADLLCFFYTGLSRPRVVTWIADDARSEYERWSSALAMDSGASVSYAAFTVAVAEDFDGFSSRLATRRPKGATPWNKNAS